MRNDLKKKAWLATMLLSLLLLGLGFGLGRLLPLEQADEANQLISQATEKVLALTQEKQALERELQAMLSQGGSDNSVNLVWQFEDAFYGLVHFGQGVVFNRELAVNLLDSPRNHQQIEVLLSGQGQRRKMVLAPGHKLDLYNGWQLSVAANGAGWAVLALQKQ